MRYETRTERIGECLGPVDWTYDFTQHYWSENRGGMNPACGPERIEWLRKLEAEPDKYEATTDGGSPKFGWQKIVAVGMYDGWPYWKPVPSVCLAGPLGPEWHSWCSLSAIERVKG